MSETGEQAPTLPPHPPVSLVWFQRAMYWLSAAFLLLLVTVWPREAAWGTQPEWPLRLLRECQWSEILAVGAWSMYGAAAAGALGLLLLAVGAYRHRVQVALELYRTLGFLALLPRLRQSIAEARSDPNLAPDRPARGLLRDVLILACVAGGFLITSSVCLVLFAGGRDAGSELPALPALGTTLLVAALVTAVWAAVHVARFAWAWRKFIETLAIKHFSLLADWRARFPRWSFSWRRLLVHLVAALAVTTLFHQAASAKATRQWEYFQRAWLSRSLQYADDALPQGTLRLLGSGPAVQVQVAPRQVWLADATGLYLKLAAQAWLTEAMAETEAAGWNAAQLRQEFAACRTGSDALQPQPAATSETLIAALNALEVENQKNVTQGTTSIKVFLKGLECMSLRFSMDSEIRFQVADGRMWLRDLQRHGERSWLLDPVQQKVVMLFNHPIRAKPVPALWRPLAAELAIVLLSALVLLAPLFYFRSPHAAAK